MMNRHVAFPCVENLLHGKTTLPPAPIYIPRHSRRIHQQNFNRASRPLMPIVTPNSVAAADTAFTEADIMSS